MVDDRRGRRAPRVSDSRTGSPPLLLQARDLVVVLPGDSGDIRVLDGVSLELEAGSVTDVVGPSGSGKTTLLRALARLLPDMSGSLVLDGLSAETIPGTEWRVAVALLPQKPAIVEGTVRDNVLRPWSLKVRHGHAAPDDSAVRAALDRVALDVALDRDAAAALGRPAGARGARAHAAHAPPRAAARRTRRRTRRALGGSGQRAHARVRRQGWRRGARPPPPLGRHRGPAAAGSSAGLFYRRGRRRHERGGRRCHPDRLVPAHCSPRGSSFFVGVVSIRLSLGITKDLAIATVRTYVQLLALGLHPALGLRRRLAVARGRDHPAHGAVRRPHPGAAQPGRAQGASSAAPSCRWRSPASSSPSRSPA